LTESWHAFLTYPMPVTCPNHTLLRACFDPLNLLGSITVIIPVTELLEMSLRNGCIPNRVLFLVGTVISPSPTLLDCLTISHFCCPATYLFSNTLHHLNSSRTFLHAVNNASGEHPSSLARYAYSLTLNPLTWRIW